MSVLQWWLLNREKKISDIFHDFIKPKKSKIQDLYDKGLVSKKSVMETYGNNLDAIIVDHFNNPTPAIFRQMGIKNIHREYDYNYDVKNILIEYFDNSYEKVAEHDLKEWLEDKINPKEKPDEIFGIVPDEPLAKEVMKGLESITSDEIKNKKVNSTLENRKQYHKNFNSHYIPLDSGIF